MENSNSNNNVQQSNGSAEKISRTDKRLIAGKAKEQFLRQLEFHQADAMIVMMNIAQGKSDQEKLETEESCALNDYLNGGFTEDSSLAEAKRLAQLIKHRGARAKKLIRSMGDFLNQAELKTATAALLDITADFEPYGK